MNVLINERMNDISSYILSSHTVPALLAQRTATIGVSTQHATVQVPNRSWYACQCRYRRRLCELLPPPLVALVSCSHLGHVQRAVYNQVHLPVSHQYVTSRRAPLACKQKSVTDICYYHGMHRIASMPPSRVPTRRRCAGRAKPLRAKTSASRWCRNVAQSPPVHRSRGCCATVACRRCTSVRRGNKCCRSRKRSKCLCIVARS